MVDKIRSIGDAVREILSAGDYFSLKPKQQGENVNTLAKPIAERVAFKNDYLAHHPQLSLTYGLDRVYKFIKELSVLDEEFHRWRRAEAAEKNMADRLRWRRAEEEKTIVHHGQWLDALNRLRLLHNKLTAAEWRKLIDRLYETSRLHVHLHSKALGEIRNESMDAHRLAGQKLSREHILTSEVLQSRLEQQLERIRFQRGEILQIKFSELNTLLAAHELAVHYGLPQKSGLSLVGLKSEPVYLVKPVKKGGAI